MSVGMELEQQYRDAGFPAVCGCDEAGAGPLMGPVYAAAVILPADCDIPGLNDSKKLTEKQRYKLRDIIYIDAVCWAVASSPAPSS